MFSINYRELLAVKLALCKLADNMENSQILLRVDNTTAISYVNKMGGTKHNKYNMLAKEIWQWAEKKHNFLFASYIASADNVQADKMSRIKNNDIEWQLSDQAFNDIKNTFGKPEIDLFATKYNAKCKRFFAWMPDDAAEKIDAFTVNWRELNFYAFPLFSLILRVLAKIKRDKASGILVVPDWPNQPWYPLFKEMLTSKPLILESDSNLLHFLCRGNKQPQVYPRLMAGRVSTKHL